MLHNTNGTWFIWVVASQSIAVLTAMIEPEITTGRRELALLAVFSWSVGVFLYAGVGVFVGVRMLFFEMHPIDLTPPYWVAMRATAITVVAAGVWRHVVHRIPLRYEAAMWSVVFRLGMYGVGGHFLGDHVRGDALARLALARSPRRATRLGGTRAGKRRTRRPVTKPQVSGPFDQ